MRPYSGSATKSSPKFDRSSEGPPLGCTSGAVFRLGNVVRMAVKSTDDADRAVGMSCSAPSLVSYGPIVLTFSTYRWSS